jgi:predicted 3-demethylubiquinone-9 3-methyltransferase (glyoxalase superfamily)
MIIDFQLDGQEFTALNGGPEFKFTEALSLVVHCKTQEEVDYYWDKLGAGGQIIECGWLKDKFGLSWQIVPDVLLELIQDDDPQRKDRVMKAMMKMKKLDVAGIERAAGAR